MQPQVDAIQPPPRTCSPVKHGGLARRDGALGFAEGNARRGIGERHDFRFGGFVMIANSHVRPDRIFGARERNPIDVANFARRAAQVAIFADDEAIICAIERDHVHRMPVGETQAAALADRVIDANHCAARSLRPKWRRSRRARPILPARRIAATFAADSSLLLQIAFDETHVIARRNEANFLALRLFRHRHREATRDFAHFLLGQFAERKFRARELFLREAKEKIDLVLVLIHGAQQFVAPRFAIVADARVVAGGDAIGADLPRGGRS